FKNEFKSSGINTASSAASKERTAPHKSNTGFPKLLCASLLIFFLLLAISFFIAFVRFHLPESARRICLFCGALRSRRSATLAMG
ncbi:C-type lectin domain family 4 member A, partial [Homo sapiens]